jgi:predicted TIM-barrel fold metal-dependent hydrolase
VTSAAIAPPRIDIHVHLAGVGTQNSGCWVSPEFRRRPAFLGLRLLYGIGPRQMERTVDQDWPARISAAVAESELDLAAVLGFDGTYDAAGKLDRTRSQLIVPLSWVFRVCERYGNLLPAPSINPLRRDALDQLDEAIERGAVLIKWLPIVQGFNPASKRAAPFLRRLADAGIPLLVHAGSGEITFRTVDPTVGQLEYLIPALEAGVTVVCAHAAAPIHHRIDPTQVPLLRSLLRRFSNLWVDNSGLANPSRFMHLPRFATDAEIHERTLHGSDFPIPSSPLFYCHQLGIRRTLAINALKNPLQREVQIKRDLGFAELTFRRAASLLANVGRWYPLLPQSPPDRLEPSV